MGNMINQDDMGNMINRSIIQMKYQVQKDGSRIYPHRGTPPEVEAGFERDRGDPFVLHPIFLPCKYRSVPLRVLPCKKEYPYKYCELKKVVVNAPYCAACHERCDS